MGFGRERMRATWQRRERTNTVGAGGTSTWLDVQTVWCEINPKRYSRDEIALQVTGRDEITMRQRWWPGLQITKDMRLDYEGKLYTPTNIQEVQERQRYWFIELQALV